MVLSVISFVYMTILLLIFIEPTYRLLFNSWPSFAAASVLAVILCLGIFVTSIGCHPRRLDKAHDSFADLPQKTFGSSTHGITRPVRSQSTKTARSMIGWRTRPISSSSSFSTTSQERLAPSAPSSVYSHPSTEESISEESYDGYIRDRAYFTFPPPPLDTNLDNHSVKEDSPTLKTPRSNVFR